MEDRGRIDQRLWPNFNQNHMKDYLKDHPAVKLMEVIVQRDAAIAERDTAMAEKKTAYAERDAALLQRDVAYADRNTAWMERDTALAALTMIRANKDNGDAVTKLMNMVNINASSPPLIEPVLALPPAADWGPTGGPVGGKRQRAKKTEEGQGPKKQKRALKENGQSQSRRKAKKSSQNMEIQQLPMQGAEMFKAEDNRDEVPRTSFMATMVCMPIPFCSCTGSNQQCYRWGNGGWQSACCTNVISTYPLPMSQTKRGARVPGRKMSGGAFRKVLEKLAAAGVDVTVPLDLKNHWAKHGTNRYVTIK